MCISAMAPQPIRDRSAKTQIVGRTVQTKKLKEPVRLRPRTLHQPKREIKLFWKRWITRFQTWEWRIGRRKGQRSDRMRFPTFSGSGICLRIFQVREGNELPCSKLRICLVLIIHLREVWRRNDQASQSTSMSKNLDARALLALIITSLKMGETQRRTYL